MDGDGIARGPVGIADGVGAALGDSGQQGASGDCPLDAAPRSEAISGYSAQSLLRKYEATFRSPNTSRRIGCGPC
jgi:hypothetical protein